VSSKQVCLYVGLLVAGVYLVGKLVRKRSILGADIAAALLLAVTPFPVPGLVDVIGRVLDIEKQLPVFDDAEARVSAGFGSALLLVGIALHVLGSLRRAWAKPESP
jgi:hypothetical protein